GRRAGQPEGGAPPGQFHAQNGPRCIQAAAGSCFAFAKRSVLIQTILRYRERLNFTPTAACRTWIFAKTSFHLTMQRCKARAALRPPKRRGQSISPGGVIAPPYVLPTSSLKSLPPLLRSHTWHFASNSVSSRVDYLSNHDLCRTKGRVVERCACCPLLASQARGAPEGLIPGRPSKPRRL